MNRISNTTLILEYILKLNSKERSPHIFISWDNIHFSEALEMYGNDINILEV